MRFACSLMFTGVSVGGSVEFLRLAGVRVGGRADVLAGWLASGRAG